MRDGEPQRFGGFEIDDQLKLRGPLDREFRRRGVPALGTGMEQ